MSSVLEEQPATQIPPARTRRYYSDREKAEALAIFDACGSLTETSKATGIPDSTLSVWTTGKALMNADVPILRSGKQLDSIELIGKFDTIANLATEHVIARLSDPKRVNKTPLPQLMTAAAISVDKSQLLRGMPTSINASVMSDEDRQAKILEIFARAESRAIDVEGKVVEESPQSE